MDSSTQSKAMIDAIAQEAKAKWGDQWLAKLVRAYCEIERSETGNEKATPINRRPQLVRALEEGNTTLETLFRLTKAVEAELNLAFIRNEIKRF